MANIKKYNLSGDEVGEFSIDDSLLHVGANTQMVKDYVVAYRANQRQWSANTKSRAEVCHSGQKPHPQKGTGRARQGFLGSPQYKGGGRVFTPKPKFNQHVKLNKKEKRAVIKTLLSQKVQENNVHVLSIEGLQKPRTKSVVEFLKKLNLMQKRVLFLGEDLCVAKGFAVENFFCESLAQDTSISPEKNVTEAMTEKYNDLVGSYETREAVIKSLRNVPKLSFSVVPNLNGYDVILNQDIILLDSSTEQFIELLGGNK